MHRGPRHARTTVGPRPAQAAGPTLVPGGRTPAWTWTRVA
jgi:hypothetical protein